MSGQSGRSDKRRKEIHTGSGAGSSRGNVVVAPSFPMDSSTRLQLNPTTDHKPSRYEDTESKCNTLLFSSLERHLPEIMLNFGRDTKIQYMRDILLRYLPESEYNRVQKHREYRQKIISNYQPLHRELYDMHPTNFFVPSFLKAITENNEESLRNMICEPFPGLLTFEMLQPRFCEMLLAEVENFQNWTCKKKVSIMRPNILNKYGTVLDDFGLETMLVKLMEDFIKPIAKVFFPDVGGSTLDSHHGFVVEYGMDRDVDLGFHVDDSEVTLNVCLGKKFSGGELFFRGVRCDKHVDAQCIPEEIEDYHHVPGRAIVHRGRHRHGARATLSGHRLNLVLWCKSSTFREQKKYQKEFPDWCGECQRVKKERQRQSVAAIKQALLEGRRNCGLKEFMQLCL